MYQFRSITICVEYTDFLALTLPFNAPWFSDTLIVTSEQDTKTQQYCIDNEIRCHVTDAFYRRGAVFNKWAALEEGLDVYGRHGWLCLLDADVALPRRIKPWTPKQGFLYTPRRRIWDPPPAAIPNERTWGLNRRSLLREDFAGYCQFFHAEDTVLGPAPWHATDWTWAGGADTYFCKKWADQKKLRTPFECLHLGPPFHNWAGRTTPFLDGTEPDQAEKRKGVRAMLLNARKANNRQNRYLAEKLK